MNLTRLYKERKESDRNRRRRKEKKKKKRKKEKKEEEEEERKQIDGGKQNLICCQWCRNFILRYSNWNCYKSNTHTTILLCD